MLSHLEFNIILRQMSRTNFPNKDTINGSTFYNTYQSDAFPFAIKRKYITNNSESIDMLNIEVESKMDKLREKITANEEKVEHNYLELELLKQEVEKEGKRLSNDKEIENVMKGQREVVKQAFIACKDRTASLCQRSHHEAIILHEAIQVRKRQIQRQKEERESSAMRLIEEFQGQILSLERQLKQIRMAQQEIFQRIQVDIYNLEQDCGNKVQAQVQSRKKEHETIIKLIGECIENFRYIY